MIDGVLYRWWANIKMVDTFISTALRNYVLTVGVDKRKQGEEETSLLTIQKVIFMMLLECFHGFQLNR